MAKTSPSSKTSRTESRAITGKKGKVFLEKKDAALALGTSIAEIQEEKSKVKAEKRHHTTTSSSGGDAARKNVPLSSKKRLKQAKAALLAEKSRVKKEKAKQKKQARVQTKEASFPSIGKKVPGTGASLPKRVSFA
ncbi:hypothetical protein QCA50_017315 [Cerrena zonata]|uniref:Uncharacterized protein n=1 Tax=Cerrena zonata TaxID=2478898 RepID=A0AAW0FJ89_9APHY